MLTAVGFDIDGTLYPDWHMRIHSLAFFFSHYRLIRAFSRVRTQIRARGKVDDIDALEAELLAREMNITPEEAGRSRDKAFFQDWEQRFQYIKPYPHVRESLLQLKAMGLKLAALSDLPVGKKLEYLGLENLFDVTLGYRETGQIKPQPAPFLLMAEQLQVKPSTLLYIGNRIKIDVRGAQEAGMRGALVGISRFWAPKDVRVFKSYPRLVEQIKSEVLH